MYAICVCMRLIYFSHFARHNSSQKHVKRATAAKPSKILFKNSEEKNTIADSQNKNVCTNVHSDFKKYVHKKYISDEGGKNTKKCDKESNNKKKCDKGTENKRQCDTCGKFYISRQSFWNHKKYCQKMIEKSSQRKNDFNKDSLQHELELMQKTHDLELMQKTSDFELMKKNYEIEVLKKTQELMGKRIGDLEEEHQTIKQERQNITKERKTKDYIIKINAESTKNATDTAKYSMSALGFLTKHFTSAKPIKTFDDFKALGGENNKRPADIAIMYYQSSEHKYHAFIGDILIKNYKKNCPSQQAVWNSDPSRDNYIVREKTSHSDTWVIDKSGCRTVLANDSPIIRTFIEGYSRVYQRRCVDIKKSGYL